MSVGALPNREQIKPLGMNGGLSNEMEIFCLIGFLIVKLPFT